MIAALISVAGCWIAAVIVFVAVLGLCAAVERVVVFYEAAPLLPIVQLQPLVYVVGPDHATDCELCRVVSDLGGQVRQAPALRSVRTTELAAATVPEEPRGY